MCFAATRSPRLRSFFIPQFDRDAERSGRLTFADGELAIRGIHSQSPLRAGATGANRDDTAANDEFRSQT